MAIRCIVRVLCLSVAVHWLSAPHVLAADSQVYVFRSVEDPDVAPDLSVCAAASFPANAVLGASLYAMQTRSSDGGVMNSSTKRIGTGTACALVTSFAVGAKAPIIGAFDIGGQRVIGEGECVLASNAVPRPGLILAGCTIPLAATATSMGGVATSNTVFNPLGFPGFDTGSLWTLRLFGD